MIKESYVSFETARLLKEKGFPQHITSHTYFVGDDKKRGCVVGEFIGHPSIETDIHLIDAPTQQMALQWLREKGIIITMDYDEYELADSDEKQVGYGWGIQKTEKPTEYLKISIHVFDNYKEAVEDAIKYCLTNLV